MAKEQFSKIGYVLAVAGSAVGLGNAWKFPYMVGENGGSAFVLLYLVICFLVGVPIFMAELSIGKLSESDSVNAFRKLADKHKNLWQYVGILAMVTAAIISCYYIVIIGWVIKYFFLSFSSLPSDIESSKAIFNELITKDAGEQTICFIAAFALCFYVLSKGVKSGIEKLNVWMMPSLFIMLLIMLGYSATMDGFVASAKFLLVPDFSKISINSLLLALGLAFWTLSLGMAAIITYSASLSDDTNLSTSTISVVLINITLAIMMGLVIFTFIFEFDATPAQGPGLVFISLPTLFAKLGFAGNILAVAFFVALIFAGITSAISIVEPFVFFLIREYSISRKKALTIVGAGVFVVGLMCVFANIENIGDKILFFGKNFFDFLDFTASNVLLPISGILEAIFVGYFMKRKALYTLFSPYMSDWVFNVWYFLLRFVAPICVFCVMMNSLFFT
ncbi:sodium-dependent transporter [Campylobacter curvus]|uniref:sodium-dependent transporter n=1 Tax=Campylobacter curvus TaxID=200 RepID=UPI000364F86C|nr:sodium-dependent transporter [Campylobacter curvus]QKF60843.1 sodium-dependent transporter, SNF family [Campylobacter curvus]UEB49164.1 sodium-dependent transporter [Campylobacter curvus]